jgi:hypothetical protein
MAHGLGHGGIGAAVAAWAAVALDGSYELLMVTKGQIGTTFSVVDIDMRVVNVLPSP